MVEEKANPTKKELNDDVEKLAAIRIIESGYAKLFGDLAKDLVQQAHLGQDLYSTSSAGDFEPMVWRSGRYKALGQRQGQRSGCGGHNGGRGSGDCGDNSLNRIVSYLQKGDSNMNLVPSIDVTNIDAECYYCRVTGHLSNNCPELPVERRPNRGSGERGSGGRTGTGMFHIRVGLEQHDDGIIPYTWLLRDTCSTSIVSNNPDMFKNIWECLEEEILTVVTNGGNKAFNEIDQY